LSHLQWVEFEAAGYDGLVPGVIYGPEAPPTNGMPLGGIDTGCLDLEATGMLGLLSIFNSLAPRRGPLLRPFLGLRLGADVHVLAAHAMPGLKAPKRIEYWGHYPIADVEFDLDAPLGVGLRAWSPFVPGDAERSMIPAAVFEVHLRNTSDNAMEGDLALSFPGYVGHEIPFQPSHHSDVRGEFTGHLVESGGHFEVRRGPEAVGYAIGVIGDAELRVGPDFGCDPLKWAALGTDAIIAPRAYGYDESGSSITTHFALDAGESRVVRLVLAWYAGTWAGDGLPSAGGKKFVHMYADRFAALPDVTNYIAREHASLLRRIVAWQSVIYTEAALPGWLQDGLVNILHLITETGVWAQATEAVGDWCRKEDGLFAMNEDPRSCPQMECLPCSVYGNLPIVYFYPQLAMSTLRAYKAYQLENGQPVFIFGGICSEASPQLGAWDVGSPDAGYQEALNGCCIIELVHKMWVRSGDDAVAHEFYELCRGATEFTMNMAPDYGEAQVVVMPEGGKDWFEAPKPGWRGYANHLGGIRLVHLHMMQRLAAAVGDAAYAERCARWFDAGAAALEKHLWNGKYYLNYFEPHTNETSDLVFSYQLDGQWFARFHGTADVFPADHVATTLETIKACNVPLSETGVVNYATPDGKPAPVGGYGTYSYFPPELLMLAMLYMYNGQQEFGLELARRCWENITCTQRLTWNQPNLLRGDVDTGERVYGNDYYQNMMLWSLPAAVAGKDLGAYAADPDGLVCRIMAV
jgi:uncharacterized protein (DUF608 family)